MKCFRAVGLCVLLSAARPMSAGAAHPLGLNENHPYGIISNAYETPHVKWARPYRGGAVKALVLAPM